MTDPGTPSVVLALLFCCAGLLLMVLGLIFQIFKKLARIEYQLSLKDPGAEPVEQVGGGVEISPGGAFEAFLNEDPARRGLTKGEQSTAYRKWRQAKGMNWSNS